MRVIRVSTTAFKEEDFFLLTTLSDEQITDVIQDVKKKYEEYDNDDLYKALIQRFPNDKINMFHELDTLDI